MPGVELQESLLFNQSNKKDGKLNLISYNIFAEWSGHYVANEEFFHLILVLILLKIVLDRAVSIFITSCPRFKSVCAALQSFPCCLPSRCIQQVEELGGPWAEILFEEAATKLKAS